MNTNNILDMIKFCKDYVQILLTDNKAAKTLTGLQLKCVVIDRLYDKSTWFNDGQLESLSSGVVHKKIYSFVRDNQDLFVKMKEYTIEVNGSSYNITAFNPLNELVGVEYNDEYYCEGLFLWKKDIFKDWEIISENNALHDEFVDVQFTPIETTFEVFENGARVAKFINSVVNIDSTGTITVKSQSIILS